MNSYHLNNPTMAVLSNIPLTLLVIYQAPEGVFDQTLCQNLALDKICAPLDTLNIPQQGHLTNN
jgi:hypothetical protein